MGLSDLTTFGNPAYCKGPIADMLKMNTRWFPTLVVFVLTVSATCGGGAAKDDPGGGSAGTGGETPMGDGGKGGLAGGGGNKGGTAGGGTVGMAGAAGGVAGAAGGVAGAAGGVAGMGGSVAGANGNGGSSNPVMEPFKMLVFSKTGGYRHDSIPSGIKMLQDLGKENNFEVTATEDAGVFTDAGLDKFQIIFFMNTTDEILNTSQQLAMERFIRKGRGFAGTHSASDTEDGLGWAWYEDLVGATFDGHGASDEAGALKIEPAAIEHPATKGLPQPWNRKDEWYRFKRDVTGLAGVQVLLRLASDNRPIAWTREWDGGRAFYTASGHGGSAFSEPHIRKHVLGGILWAAKRAN